MWSEPLNMKALLWGWVLVIRVNGGFEGSGFTGLCLTGPVSAGKPVKPDHVAAAWRWLTADGWRTLQFNQDRSHIACGLSAVD